MTPIQMQRLLSLQRQMLKRRVRARTEAKLGRPIISTGARQSGSASPAVNVVEESTITQPGPPVKDILSQIQAGTSPTQAIKNVLAESKTVSKPPIIVTLKSQEMNITNIKAKAGPPFKAILSQIQTGTSPTQAIQNVMITSKKIGPAPSNKNIKWTTRNIGGIYKVSDFQYEIHQQGLPPVDIPTGPFGEYDIVKIRTLTAPGTNRVIDKRYEFSYSPEARHKIEVAGSIKNYDAYLEMTRNHPELVALRAMHGGEGVGPFGLIPDFGVTMAFTSNEPGITGASPREEKIIKYLYETRGNAEDQPSLIGLGKYVISDVPVQFAVVKAATTAAAPVLKATYKGAQKIVPYVIEKLPGSKNLIKSIAEKTIDATAAVNRLGAPGLGGAGGYNITKTEVIQNFLKWAREGYVPVTRTTGVVVDKPFTDKVVDYIKGIPKKDFERYIKFKPETWYGFAERGFISPERAAYYTSLFRQGPIKEVALIGRGEIKDPSAWYKLQGIIDETTYRRGLRNVLRSYKSREFNAGFNRAPKTIEGPSLTESQAAMKAILEGGEPGMGYGSLYNVQKIKPGTGGIPQKLSDYDIQYLLQNRLSGDISYISKQQNIWAKQRLRSVFGKEPGTASLLRQPRMVSAEEQSLVSRMRYLGDTTGKGAGRQALQQIMIPSRNIGLQNLGLLFFSNQIPPDTSLRDFNIQMLRWQRELIRKSQRRTDQFFIPATGDKTITGLDQSSVQERQFRRQIQRQSQEIAQTEKQIQKQIQRQIQAEKTMTGTPVDYMIDYADYRDIRDIPKHGGTVVFPPPMMPWLFPGLGGRFTKRGHMSPFQVQYYNELEATRRLVKEVIF